VLRVPGRAFPVTLAHAQDAPRAGELLQAALDTVWDVHVNEPPGDVLLFMTGADEIERAARELNARVAAAPPEECTDMQARAAGCEMRHPSAPLRLAHAPRCCRCTRRWRRTCRRACLRPRPRAAAAW
jgi:HrpA-like RNA helicase